MKRAGIASACIASALALATVGANSASALEIGRCVASPGTGKYKTATCTTKAGANASEKEFEFLKNAVNKKFKMAGGVSSFGLAHDSANRPEWLVACSHESGTGEYHETGSTPATKSVWHVNESWTECEVTAQHASAPFGEKCQSAGQSPGTVVSGTLAGKLGYIEKVTGKPRIVGLELHPEAKGASFMSFECGAGLNVQVKEGGSGGHGCVIGQLSTPNEMSSFFFLNYSAKFAEEAQASEQVPHVFQGSSHTCTLESTLPDPFLFLGGSTFTNEEALEIKA
jgi:hypothetical protein